MNLAFGRGLDQRAPETALAPGFVRDVVNLDIAPGQYAQKVPLGHARTRIGRTLVHAGVNLRGGWSDRRVPFALCADGTAMVALEADGTRTTLATVTAGHGICAEYVEAQAAVYWSNGIERGRIVSGVNVPWGLPEPAAPVLSVTAGTLAFGTYTVAVTCRNAAGEEGGASPLASITLASTGGVSVTLPVLPAGASAFRVYLGGPDADEDALYWLKDVTASTVLTGSEPPGRRIQTLYLRRMPACTALTLWNGRLWAAVGNLLVFSTHVGGLPHYGLYDGRGGFFRFPAPVRMALPVYDGLYVGTDTETLFLRGDAPLSGAQPMRREPVDAAGVIGASMIPAAAFRFGDQVQPEQTDTVPAWLSTDGEVIVGRAGGMLQRLTRERVAMSPETSAALAFVRDSRGDRLLVSTTDTASPLAADAFELAGLIGNGIEL